MRVKLCIWVVTSLIAIHTARAQSTYQIITDKGETIYSKRDSTDAAVYLVVNKVIAGWRELGHLAAGLDAIEVIGDSINFKLHRGRNYQTAYISWESLPDELRLAAGIKSKVNRPYSFQRIAKDITKLLDNRGENGYPFAQVEIDSLGYEDGIVNLSLSYLPGPYVRFDSLRVSGLKRTNFDYLSKHLGLVEGEPFKESTFQDIRANVDRLDFLTLDDEPELVFVNNKAIVNMNLKEESVNKLDAVLGLLQNDLDGLVLTGTADIELLNLFGRAKELRLNWQRQKEQSQTLDISYYEPRLAGSQLGLGVNYNQLKEDTSFVNRQFGLSMSIPIGRWVGRLQYSRSSGRLLGIPNSEAPTFAADYNVDKYGLEIEIDRMPAQANRAGFSLISGIDVGDRGVLRNPGLSSVLYDSISLSSIQYQFEFTFEYILPIRNRFSFYQRINFRSLFNNQLFLNDLYRLGGLGSLRGFNELSIFANDYISSTMEIRFQLDSKSYMFGFYDQARYRRELSSLKTVDFPFGLGLGISLNTETGIFHLVYALGSSRDQSLSFSQAKIHFGFTSTF